LLAAKSSLASEEAWQMRTRWAILTAALLCCPGVPGLQTDSASAVSLEPLSIESIVLAYPTPKGLAQFLRQAITFTTDEELFGEPDHWQAPEEFLARRAGDCEDYALFAQAVLQRQGIEAHVLSVFGEEGYAHTVCAFRQSGCYHVLNQDRVQACGAKTLEALAWQLYRGWTYGALSRLTGTRGEAVRTFYNPTPSAARWQSDPVFSFP